MGVFVFLSFGTRCKTEQGLFQDLFRKLICINLIKTLTVVFGELTQPCWGMIQ